MIVLWNREIDGMVYVCKKGRVGDGDSVWWCRLEVMAWGLGLRSTHTEGTPDVGRALYSPQWLHSRMEVLRLLGVGDEYCRPLLKL